MTEKIDLDQGFGRKELKKIIRRFTALHKQRLIRLESELTQVQKDFLSLLPLLLHINHPTLPGFISTEVPCGLADYHPDRKTLLIAKKFGRSFEYKRRALRTIPIQGLYLMGSIGTIGQTADSDLDFWLCHAHDLNRQQLGLLQKKAELIEQFGLEYGLEVHFFLMDAEAFKAGKKLTLSTESSGSTQHHLLLEEFYRTGILIAGRPPLWWIVPAEQEDNYNEYTQELIRKRFIDPLDWIDFGGMENVPPEEFFGAAHWQLYKGIESPYKAILKILLMESYASDFPDISWLSLISKKAIFYGDDDVLDIDPYVLIYRQVESYLSMRGENDRLDLARRCFYFKVNLPLSRQTRSSEEWKKQKLQQLVNEWQWTDEYIALLDSRDKWKLEQVKKERNILVGELTHSYRVLMNFARSNAATGGIDPLELNLLGRKLYAALERRPGKIDLINPGISKDLHEPQLCFQYEEIQGQVRWQLFRSDPVPDDFHQKPLKTTSNLVELVAWCHCNGVIDRGIQIILRPYNCPVSLAELRQLLDLIQLNLPAHLNIKPQLSELEKKPHALMTMMFINIGFDPLERLSRAGLQLTSKRSDPLSFSATQINLAQRLEQLTVNSWGEIEVFTYDDSEGLLESLCRYLQTFQMQNQHSPFQINGFGSSRRQSIALRMEQIGNDLIDCFFVSGTGLNSKYILQIDTRYALIHHHNSFNYLLFDEQEELLDHLGEHHDEFSPIVFDELAFIDQPLPLVCQLNRPDTLQLFAWQQQDGTQLYVLDEHGALFHQFVKKADEKHLLIQQQRFFNSLSDRRALLSVDNTTQMLTHATEFYRIKKSSKNQWEIENAYLPETPLADNYLDLELLAGNGPDSLKSYTIVCGQQEFDYLLLSNDIYVAVAAHVLNMRKSTKTYPVYLTSISPTGMDDDRSWSTINLLNFKKRLETQVNIALQQLAYDA